MVKITNKEAICIAVLFLLGSNIVIGSGMDVQNDNWIAGIFGFAYFVPFAFMYARIQALHGGKDLPEIANHLFGRVFGFIITAVYTWYSLHVGALVLRNFGEFVKITTLTETPLLVIMLSFSVIIIAAARLGIEVMGRLSTYALPLVVLILVFMEAMSVSQMNFDFVKPVFVHGFQKIAWAGFSAFTFPFGESVIFLGILYSLKKRESAYRIYMTGMVISGIILVTLTLMNIFILGPVEGDFYFPSHSSFSRIRLGDFLQRMEGTISVSYAITCFIKASVCLFVACKGIASVFGLSDYRFITIQTGLIMTYLAFILYKNTVEMENWVINVYKYYAIPFQIVIPLLIWIRAEFKNRKGKRPKKSEELEINGGEQEEAGNEF